MSTVSITVTGEGGEATWGTQSPAWNDYGDATWNTVRPETLCGIGTDVSAASAIIKAATLSLDEIASISDVGARCPNKTISEACVVADLPSMAPTKQFYENVSILDAAMKLATMNAIEEVCVTENAETTTLFIRNFLEQISIEEKVAKSVQVAIAESFQVADIFLEPWFPSVESEIAIFSTPLDEKSFAEHLLGRRPWGFKPWETFVPGEYSIKEAAFRVRMKNTAPQDITDAVIAGLVVKADTPDIIERGIVTTNGYTKVLFTKKFNAPPTVLITSFVSPYFAIPEVVEVTSEYFVANARKTNNQPTIADLQWMAHGY